MIRLDPHFDIRQKRECPWYQHVITMITIFLCRFDSHWFLLIPILSPLVPPDNPIVSHEFPWSPTISSWNITVFLSGRVLPVCLSYHDDFPWISMNSQQFPLFHPDFQSKITRLGPRRRRGCGALLCRGYHWPFEALDQGAPLPGGSCGLRRCGLRMKEFGCVWV